MIIMRNSDTVLLRISVGHASFTFSKMGRNARAFDSEIVPVVPDK